MRFLRVSMTVIAVFGAALTVFANQGEPARSKKEAGVHGYVLDAKTGKPLVGVTVSALSGRSVVKSDATDAAGYFRIRELPEGNMSIVFDKKGYRFVRKDVVKLKAGEMLQLNVRTQQELLPEDYEHPVIRLMEGVL
ncbi:MAG: carboxypeptidase-like regulatory domain-containing protein [Flavihumibacter sp.]